ncbi:MAG: hypothetical protein ACM3ML_00155 [Micromonosporaceae bacterium]
MTHNRLPVYRVDVRGQLPRIVTCDQLVEADDEFRFVYGSDQQVVVFKVARPRLLSWEMKSIKGRHPGVRRARSLLGVVGALPGAVRDAICR